MKTREIAEELLDAAKHYDDELLVSAAAKIRELEASNKARADIIYAQTKASEIGLEKLKIATEALEPFGKAGGLFDTGKYQQRAAAIYSPAAGEEFYLNSGHLLKARDALARIKEGANG